jgi:hypothetical protein
MSGTSEGHSLPSGAWALVVAVVGAVFGPAITLLLTHGWRDNPPPVSPPAVYFSPKGGCTEAITAIIGQSKSEVRVQAYAFDSYEIATALCDARRRGVTVLALMDKSCRDNPRNLARHLHDEGVTVRVDEEHAIAHNKVIIVDESHVITGSFNFTRAAEETNAENLIVFSDPRITAQYRRNWDLHWGHSKDFQPGPFGSDPSPITPEEAARRLGQVCTVEMRVMSVGSYNDLVFLNSRVDYKDKDNLTFVVHPSASPARFSRGEDFARYLKGFSGKTIQVVGKVSPHQGRSEVAVTSPRQLLHLPE